MSILQMILGAGGASGGLDQGGIIASSTPVAAAGFGALVALSGDGTTLAAAGTADQPDDDSVFVYLRTNQTWASQQKITISNPGKTIAVRRLSLSEDGNTLAIADGYQDDGSAFTGSVWIYVRGGGVWTLQQRINGAVSFGVSVSLSPNGTTLAVGIQSDNLSTGRVDIYTLSAGTWSLQQSLTASDGATSRYFGVAVAVAGNTLVVGANGVPTPATDAGALYVFTRSGATWTQRVKLTSADLANSSNLGTTVAISKDEQTIVAAARTFAGAAACSGGLGRGAVFSWVGSGATWTELPFYTEGCGAFGADLSLSSNGQLLAVSSGRENVALLVRSGAGWASRQSVVATPVESGDDFGRAAALSYDGRHLVVGARLRDQGALSNSGAVFYFYL